MCGNDGGSIMQYVQILKLLKYGIILIILVLFGLAMLVVRGEMRPTTDRDWEHALAEHR